jgi:hypothetical protein
VRYKTNTLESLLLGASANLGYPCPGPVLIEGSTLQMRIGPLKQVELAAALRGGYIDSCRMQLPNVFVTTHGIDDVDGLFAPFEAIFYEWQ